MLKLASLFWMKLLVMITCMLVLMIPIGSVKLVIQPGQMPVQSVANNFAELLCLNPRLVCLRVPFMKMVALPSGKQ